MFRNGINTRGSGGISKSQSLLQKASAQLKGDRLPKTSASYQNPQDDDDIGAYLSSLNRKTTEQIKNVPTGASLADLSDLSMSTTEDSSKKMATPTPVSNSRFLKKKTADPQQSPKLQQKPKTASSTDFEESRASKPMLSSSPLKKPQSSALSKASSFASKYEKKPTLSQAFQISDSDMDFSVDEDVIKDVKLKSNVSTATGRFGEKSPLKSGTVSPSDDESIGKGGSRFLKKVAKTGVSPGEVGWGGKPLDIPNLDISQDSDRGRVRPRNKMTVSFDVSDDSISSDGHKPRGLRYSGNASVKASTSVSFDTDDEIHYIDVGSPSSSLEPDGIFHKPPRSPTGMGVIPKGKGVLKKPRRSPSPEKHSPSPPPMRRTPTPPLTQATPSRFNHSSNPMSEEDEISSDDSFKSKMNGAGLSVNVMELDSLEPLLVVEKESSSRKSTPRKSDKKSTTKDHKNESQKKADKSSKKSENEKMKKTNEKPSVKSPANDIFASMGLYSVDDLIGRSPSPEVQSEASEVYEVPSVASEIKTDSESVQQYESDFESDIYSEHSRSRSPSPKLKAKHFSGSAAKSLDVISEADVISSARSVPTYSDDLETLHTEKTESVTEATRSNTRRGSYSDSESSDTVTRRRSPSPSYSDSSSYTDSYSYTYESYTRTDSRSIKKKSSKKTKTTSAGVQTTDDTNLWYHWNSRAVGQAYADKQYGLNLVDPTPIASHVISADTLEAVTAYSPVVLALHDLLKQQLQLTQHFVDSQKQLHRSFVEALEPDHHYTTLEDTKQYIRKNRKQTLTFKEALQAVKEEMNLD